MKKKINGKWYRPLRNGVNRRKGDIFDNGVKWNVGWHEEIQSKIGDCHDQAYRPIKSKPKPKTPKASVLAWGIKNLKNKEITANAFPIRAFAMREKFKFEKIIRVRITEVTK